ncbi:MAG: tRNA dihydrouridine synthase DusB [Bauldia sp.]|nr:tRNA dihydrouridine synthase DusB [Bauldia sp.]
MITNPAASDAGLLARPLRIGDIQIPNRVLLAPMSGVSDRPFRTIAHKAGAGLVVSEMVASELFVRGDAEARLRSESVGAGIHVVQLAGREARWMAEAAQAAEEAGAAIIDINMGCPARKVTSGACGSALMRDLDHALRLIEATVAATSRPVTLKMRLGWDAASVNAPELARRAEAAGVRMVTVHGRTRSQFYDGAADWDAVAAVKAAISVPLIVNGDIVDLATAAEAIRRSGADGVMVGRGAYGRPGLPGTIAREAAGEGAARPTPAEIAEEAAAHYEAILAHYGVAVGLKAARKHLGWYLQRMAEAGAAGADAFRGPLQTANDPAVVLALLGEAASAGRKLAA